MLTVSEWLDAPEQLAYQQYIALKPKRERNLQMQADRKNTYKHVGSSMQQME